MAGLFATDVAESAIIVHQGSVGEENAGCMLQLLERYLDGF